MQSKLSCNVYILSFSTGLNIDPDMKLLLYSVIKTSVVTSDDCRSQWQTKVSDDKYYPCCGDEFTCGNVFLLIMSNTRAYSLVSKQYKE